jgi:hypothetical protein
LQRTLKSYVNPTLPYCEKLNPTEIQKVANLLPVLAVADGIILIENMPDQLLDEAARIFWLQRERQILLICLEKCIRSLIGFSSSVYELPELPNMRKL